MDNKVIVFIGGGNMTLSLVTGLIDSGYPHNKIMVADPHPEKRKRFEQEFKIETHESDSVLAKKAEVLLLAVKPQDLKKVGEELKEIIKDTQPLLISIAAGIGIKHINDWFGPLPCIRAMPNTAALLRVGATALYASSKVSEDQKNMAESIMRAVGIIVWVNHEHDMDTVTALSASGPAFLFFMLDAMQKGATQLGLPNETAKILTLQMALGAARMALESDLPLDELIKRVASKGGTTEKGLEILQQHQISEVLHQALKKAKERAEEMSKQLER